MGPMSRRADNYRFSTNQTKPKQPSPNIETMTAIRRLYQAALLLLLSLTSPTNAKGPSRAEFKAQKIQEAQKIADLKASGQDSVSMTKEAAELRAYELRKKKTKGLIRKREVSLASVLFPGASPEEYSDGEPLPAFVDVVESRKTQLPFEYYDLPTCEEPNETIQKRFRQRKNLGARMMGHSKMKMSPYQFPVKVDKECTPLCTVTVGGKNLKWLRKLVDRQYRINLTLDQLPVLMRSKELDYAARSYPLGFKAAAETTGLKNDEYFFYNHLRFTVFYREEPSEFEGVRIVGFDVHPVSIDHHAGSEGVSYSDCIDASPVNDPSTFLELRSGPTGEDVKILYSYEVAWEQSDIPWADRWDVYLVGSPDDEIHYFAIVNSLMIVMFLVGAVATILIRTLNRDIAGYNALQTLEEAQEETGWKLVHGDVFRPPQNYQLLLCALIGTGAQIGSAIFMMLLASMLRMLNPLKKGQALTAVVLLYVLCGGIGGYVSARLYKFCDATSWKKATLATAVAFPGTIVAMFTVLNIFLSMAGSATAVSFLTIFLVFLLWGCVATPLVFVGSYFGFRAGKIEVPTKTNQIARVIPEVPFYSTPPMSMFLAALLPFGSVTIELYFIMSALWLHQLYYIMSFLMAVLLILLTTVSMVSMVTCYIQLCAEDHRWWWKSFLNGTCVGIYVFLYSLWFLGMRMGLVGVLPVVVYLTYMTMISMALGLVCGTVGYLSCFWFTKKIYGAVKAD
jgi:transmembrane 9 superfamily protein 2/4